MRLDDRTHRPYRIAATNALAAKHLYAVVEVFRQQALAMLDSGCTGILITPQFAAAAGISLVKKKRPLNVYTINNKLISYNNRKISYEMYKILL